MYVYICVHVIFTLCVAVCCCVLQCATVCCSVLLCVAVCYCVLQAFLVSAVVTLMSYLISGCAFDQLQMCGCGGGLCVCLAVCV